MTVEAIDPQEQRPLHERDMWARNFPRELMGTIPWVNCESLLDLTALGKNKTVSWNPRIRRLDNRWLITVDSESRWNFGIDALRLGLGSTLGTSREDLELLPYIHFRELDPTWGAKKELKEHSVAYVTLVLMKDWQLRELKSIVNSVE